MESVQNMHLRGKTANIKIKLQTDITELVISDDGKKTNSYYYILHIFLCIFKGKGSDRYFSVINERQGDCNLRHNT